jgi:ankyrin repeat protein
MPAPFPAGVRSLTLPCCAQLCATKPAKSTPGHVETLDKLIEGGANVNAACSKGQTAIARAAGVGSVASVLVLLKAGAKSDPVDSQGRTPLMEAAANKFSGVAEILLKEDEASKFREHGISKTNVQDAKGMTPLMYAAKGDSLELVEMLLRHKADPLVQDAKGKTAVKFAKKKSTDLVKALEGACRCICSHTPHTLLLPLVPLRTSFL